MPSGRTAVRAGWHRAENAGRIFRTGGIAQGRPAENAGRIFRRLRTGRIAQGEVRGTECGAVREKSGLIYRT